MSPKVNILDVPLKVNILDVPPEVTFQDVYLLVNSLNVSPQKLLLNFATCTQLYMWDFHLSCKYILEILKKYFSCLH